MTAAWRAARRIRLTRVSLPLVALMFAAPAQGVDKASPVSAPPDYAQSYAWAVNESGGPNRIADVFYIHPTTFLSQEWNQSLADAAAQTWTRVSVVDRQLSAFSDCCRRIMPWYRQASTRAFAERDGRGAAAYDLAYGDVRAAFRHYLANSNHGRPFILAGHSQGALLGLRLLHDEIASTPAARRLVAAYLPGIGIPAGALPASIPVCRHPAQTRCAISWNSFTPHAETSAWAERAQRDYGLPGRDRHIICINPLTFKASQPAAAASAAKGWLPVAARDAQPLPIAIGAVSASCKNGVLRVTTTSPAPAPIPGGILHMHDIALFWGDIATNARLRVRAFHGARR